MLIDEELARRFACARCKASGGTVNRVAVIGLEGLNWLLQSPSAFFLAVSCKACGYTDMFKVDVLDKKKDLGAALDAMYGK